MLPSNLTAVRLHQRVLRGEIVKVRVYYRPKPYRRL